MNGLKVPVSGPVFAAIAVNLIPIVGVILWGWSAFALIFLYWLENVVIGVRTMLSMLVSGVLNRQSSLPAALFFAAFFAVHYGIFCYGHGVFVVLTFGATPEGSSFDLVGAARALFALRPDLIWGLASIVLWQLVIFVLFIAKGEARTASPLDLMGAPYPRIIVLHLTVILGAMLVLGLNQPVLGLAVLAVIKMLFDIAEAKGWQPVRFPRPRRV